MYYPGEIRSPGLELMLILMRVAIIIGAFFLVAGVGLVLNIPVVISGTVAGLIAFTLFTGGLFEVITYRCPSCGQAIRTIRGYGSYRCSRCGKESYIEGF
ncbi:hypothetical protein [Desulfovirgula thermocuniculi]|uniref:hypothetical protein n=1 Tax=Desulfovirgula thermocuniculi TaxID=348842 RepID=UPI000400C69E|nr:hypothetical protein [Desulfovirgula thermocuniculi]